MESNQRDSVFKVVAGIIGELEGLRETSSGKALLSKLRNSISQPISRTIHVWPLLYRHLPKSFLGNGNDLTEREQAILTTIQLFALHQQGNTTSVNWRKIKKENADADEKADEKTDEKTQNQYHNMGVSLSGLHWSENSVAMDRRFNAMITATTYEELVYHLRQMVGILKSNKSGEKINYPRLAADLYSFLKGDQEKLRLTWAKSYYSTKKRGEDHE